MSISSRQLISEEEKEGGEEAQNNAQYLKYTERDRVLRIAASLIKDTDYRHIKIMLVAMKTDADKRKLPLISC